MAAALLLSVLPAPVRAADDAAVAAAENLHALGLFNGTGTNPDGSPNFALDRAPTRQEAVAMLVRLLGKEAEALAGAWSTPFTDVDDWAKPYVGYAYHAGLANGTGAATFGGRRLVTAAQYLTFVLRALGYDSAADFAWDKAWELSDQIGLTNGSYNAATNASFLRGDAAVVSKSALRTKLKDTETALFTRLMDDGAITGVIREIAEMNLGIRELETETFTVPEGEFFTTDMVRGKFTGKIDLSVAGDIHRAFPYQLDSLTHYQSIENMLNSILTSEHLHAIAIATGAIDWEGRGSGYGDSDIQYLAYDIHIIFDDDFHVCAIQSAPPVRNADNSRTYSFIRIDFDFSAQTTELLKLYWKEIEDAPEYYDVMKILSLSESIELGLELVHDMKWCLPILEKLPVGTAFICAQGGESSHPNKHFLFNSWINMKVGFYHLITKPDEYTHFDGNRGYVMYKGFLFLDKDYKIIGYTFIDE